MRKFLAFSIVELIVGLVIMSVMLVAFMPVLTKKKKASVPVVQMNSSSLPKGAIIFWLGTNYPDDWEPLLGQDITDEKYEALKDALGEQIETLPDLSSFASGDNTIVPIIKVK